MSSRIVLFLGEHAHCSPARYALSGCLDDPAHRKTLLPWTVLVDALKAMAADQDGPVQIVVVTSKAALPSWHNDGHLDDDAENGGVGDRSRFPIAFLVYDESDFDPGSTAFWLLFDRLKRVLGGEPLTDLGLTFSRGSAPGAFDGQAACVIIDITHGFRAIPFVGASALAFAQAHNRRRNQVVRHRVYYAKKSDNGAECFPVWDLTPFVEGLILSDALDAFARHGRADDLAAFFDRSNAAGTSELKEPTTAFADDLLFMRIPLLMNKSGPSIHHALNQSLGALKQDLPPVAEDLTAFADQIEQLVPGGSGVEPISYEGLVAAKVLADRLLATGRNAELYNLLREALLTGLTLVVVNEPMTQQRSNAFNAQRKEIDRRWSTWYDQAIADKPLTVSGLEHIQLKQYDAAVAKQVLKSLKAISDERNDVAHCSMRSAPKSASQLRRDLEKAIKEFGIIVEAIRQQG